MVDAGGGVPEADRNRERVYCGRCRWRYPGGGRSWGNVYCARCRWRYPGSGPQQRKGLLWSIALVTSRERAAAEEMSTVVDAGGGVPEADRSRGIVYCGRCRWWRPGSGSQQGKGLLWSMPVAVPREWPQRGKCLLCSMPVAVSRERTATEKGSTVVDSIGDVPGAGRSRENVYCGRCRWRYPEADRNREMSTVLDAGGGIPGADRNRKMSTVLDAGGVIPEQATTGEMSTVVDVGEAVTGADRNRERVYCGR